MSGRAVKPWSWPCSPQRYSRHSRALPGLAALWGSPGDSLGATASLSLSQPCNPRERCWGQQEGRCSSWAALGVIPQTGNCLPSCQQWTVRARGSGETTMLWGSMRETTQTRKRENISVMQRRALPALAHPHTRPSSVWAPASTPLRAALPGDHNRQHLCLVRAVPLPASGLFPGGPARWSPGVPEATGRGWHLLSSPRPVGSTAGETSTGGWAGERHPQPLAEPGGAQTPSCRWSVAHRNSGLGSPGLFLTAGVHLPALCTALWQSRAASPD